MTNSTAEQDARAKELLNDIKEFVKEMVPALEEMLPDSPEDEDNIELARLTIHDKIDDQWQNCFPYLTSKAEALAFIVAYASHCLQIARKDIEWVLKTGPLDYSVVDDD